MILIDICGTVHDWSNNYYTSSSRPKALHNKVIQCIMPYLPAPPAPGVPHPLECPTPWSAPPAPGVPHPPLPQLDVTGTI